MTISLQLMTPAEIDAYRAWIIEDYARDLAHYQRLPMDEALAASAGDINASLLTSAPNPMMRLFNIIADGTQVGYLWIEVNLDRKRCFIHDIYLHEPQRDHGYGRQTLERLEADLRCEGVRRIGLHVFAGNDRARALYQRLGFEDTGYNMHKWLDDAPKAP